MSNWQETCQRQLARLEKTALLADKLSGLCHKAQADLTPDIAQALANERPRLNRQLERLRANRFEVAVIGLEKAGKSALLNAWLGQEILPSEDRRCTYTTTEIWSAATEQDQQLLIEYYNHAEIDSLLSSKKADLEKLKPGSRDYNDHKADIDETEQNLTKIYHYAKPDKSNIPIPFSDIAEISDKLYEAVAGRQYTEAGSAKIVMDRAHPRAIKRIQLKTTRLAGMRDLVFHDVPGFNSTVTKHREEAVKRMEECDAIIFAKKMDNFNLDVSETSILSVADADHVKLEEKIFVVLTQADKALDREQYDKWLRDNQNEWGNVPKQRIVAVCAIAHLAELGTCSADTRRLGAKSSEKLHELDITNGIASLKQTVDAYIDAERSAVLQKRCDAIVGIYKKQAQIIFRQLEQVYSQLTDVDTDEEDLYGKDFNKWWGSEWKRIKEEFENWYVSTIDKREDADSQAGEHEKLAELRKAYNDQVCTIFNDLDIVKPEKMASIYKATTVLTPIPAYGNKAIRDALYPKIHQILQQELPNQLTGSLKAITDEIVEKAKQSLFLIEDVERGILENPALVEKQIRHGFETLFLRFGRVAVDVFIALPLAERSRLLKEIEPEINTLESFYKGLDKDKKGNLTDYLRYGLWLAKTLGAVPPLADATINKTYSVSSTPEWNPFNISKSTESAQKDIKEPKNLQEVIKEIQDDLDALQNYLQNSVFYAAGFITYSRQELQRIRERFIGLEDNERAWDAIIRRETKRHNPNIPFKIANRMQDFRLKREIALELQEAKELFGNVI